MKHRFLLGACLIALSAPVLAQDAAADAALNAIRDLGTLNGQALACAETDVASRAKKLMLAHAPKTQAYGDAYQNATQQVYMNQTQAKDGCADAKSLSATLDALAQRLNATLPVAR